MGHDLQRFIHTRCAANAGYIEALDDVNAPTLDHGAQLQGAVCVVTL